MIKKRKRIIILVSSLLAAALIALNVVFIVLGLDFQGPYRGLAKVAITNTYNSETCHGNVVFYGASQFTKWHEMEEDLKPYKVQNHGFGGSTDKDLVAWADDLLYPYEPSIVFFQTGSNDYVQSKKATDVERIQESMDYKMYMFEMFHEKLPNAKFVVVSGLLLPGRSQYSDMTKKINKKLSSYCESLDYMYYLDTVDLTYDSKTNTYYEEMFVSDRIHLTHEARIQWAQNYILPELALLDAPKP